MRGSSVAQRRNSQAATGIGRKNKAEWRITGSRLPCAAKHPGGLGLRPLADGSVTRIADYLDEGDLTMLLSWLRSPKAPKKRPTSYRPSLETLDERIVPANPHLVSATSSIDSAGALVANFKETGLGDTVQINYTLFANASATYVYVNHGGNLPRAPQFTVVAGPVDATGTFTSGLNGQITASLTAQPPGAPQSFIDPAPKGQHVALFSVSYTTVTLADTTNAVFVSLADQSAQLIVSNHG